MSRHFRTSSSYAARTPNGSVFTVDGGELSKLRRRPGKKAEHDDGTASTHQHAAPVLERQPLREVWSRL
jgi:hypothetical protein